MKQNSYQWLLRVSVQQYVTCTYQVSSMFIGIPEAEAAEEKYIKLIKCIKCAMILYVMNLFHKQHFFVSHFLVCHILLIYFIFYFTLLYFLSLWIYSSYLRSFEWNNDEEDKETDNIQIWQDGNTKKYEQKRFNILSCSHLSLWSLWLLSILQL
jgi:hypothetical protein